MKKDEQINKLFEEYAEELAPHEELSSKARAAMTASNQKRSSSPRKKNGWVHLAWILPVWIVFALSLALVSRVIFGHGGNGNPPGDDNTSQAVDYYTFANVKGNRVELDDEEYIKVDNYINVSTLKKLYEVVGERYYAFYTYGDKQLRYIKAYIGVRSQNGIFTELEIIAELDGYVRDDLKEIYESVANSSGFVSRAGYDESGEYITKGYFEARGAHFYVIARNGQFSGEASQIISKIM